MSTQASVTISIYNPMNWPLSLFKWIVNDDRNYLPAFEAIATTADRGLGWALGRSYKVGWDHQARFSSSFIYGIRMYRYVGIYRFLAQGRRVGT